MLTLVNSYKSLIQHFRLSVAMVTNQNEEFVKLLYAWWRTTQQTFIKTFSQNTCTCGEIVLKTYFHFSHYKSMETLSCHSNESTWATAMQKKNNKQCLSDTPHTVMVNKENYYREYKSHTKWLSLISSHFANIIIFGMTLHMLITSALYVHAKNQKASVKALVQVDFLMYALSKHKYNPY